MPLQRIEEIKDTRTKYLVRKVQNGEPVEAIDLKAIYFSKESIIQTSTLRFKRSLNETLHYSTLNLGTPSYKHRGTGVPSRARRMTVQPAAPTKPN